MSCVSHPFDRHGKSGPSNRHRTKAASETDTLAAFAHLDGDHCTLLNVYRAYESMQKGATLSRMQREQWCEEHGLCFHALNTAWQIRSHLSAHMQACIENGIFTATLTATAQSTGKELPFPNRKRSLEEEEDLPAEGEVSDSARASLEILSCGHDFTALRRSLVVGTCALTLTLLNYQTLICLYRYHFISILICYLLRVHPSHCNTGYFSRVARLDPDGQYTTLHGGLRVEPHSLSTCGRYAARPEWVLYEDIVDGGKFQIAFPAAVVYI